MSVSEELARINATGVKVQAGKAAIAEAITSKGVPTETTASFDTLAVNIGLIEGGGGATGVRKVQFEVELDAESDYLPLSRLTEIPEMLIVSSYDATVREAESGYGGISSANPSFDHVTSLVVNMVPMPYFNYNSGMVIQMSGASGYVYGYSTYYQGGGTREYNRYTGYGAGYLQPVSVPHTTYQEAFVDVVKKNRYALDANGKLVIRNNPTGNQFTRKFAANVKYIVTALYDVLDDNTIGIVQGLDRSVNPTNVVETV